MPLDRPITVGIRGPDDHNAAGILVPGVVVQHPVFATALDISGQRNLETGGARNQIDRVYRVRWFEELAIAPPTSIEITSELGVVFASARVRKISEYVGRFGDLRRRWLDIEIITEQAARL